MASCCRRYVSCIGRGAEGVTLAKRCGVSICVATRALTSAPLNASLARPFSSPTRYAAGTGEQQVNGSWQRTIATARSIVSYITQLRLPAEAQRRLDHRLGSSTDSSNSTATNSSQSDSGGNPPQAVPPYLAGGATLWFAPHAAHTSVYVPFNVGVSMSDIPAGYWNSSVDAVDRGVSAWQAARFVYNVAQLRFDLMSADVRAAQTELEQASLALQRQLDADYAAHGSVARVSAAFSANAQASAERWWRLSDELLLKYADGWCNADCGSVPRSMGYPAWWLEQVGYEHGPGFGPPPSPATALSTSNSLGTHFGG